MGSYRDVEDAELVEGMYELHNGTAVMVRIARSGKFYARRRNAHNAGWHFCPGLIYQLSAEILRDLGAHLVSVRDADDDGPRNEPLPSTADERS